MHTNNPLIVEKNRTEKSSERNQPIGIKDLGVVDTSGGNSSDLKPVNLSSAKSDGDNAGSIEAIPDENQLLAYDPTETQYNKGSLAASTPWPDSFFEENQHITEGDEFNIELPESKKASGGVAMSESDESGLVSLTVILDHPGSGIFYAARQSAPGVAGSVAGHIVYENSTLAYRIEPDMTT